MPTASRSFSRARSKGRGVGPQAGRTVRSGPEPYRFSSVPADPRDTARAALDSDMPGSLIEAARSIDCRAKTRPSADAAPKSAPTCLARFVVEQRPFQLVLCRTDTAFAPAEMARFRIDGHTLAVVTDPEADGADPEMRNIAARLTERELQIVILIARGDATKHIARKLRISEWTVSTHLRRIFTKLHVGNRAALVFHCASLIASIADPNASDGRRICGKPTTKPF